MSKIARVLQKIFASGASNNGQFGSAQLGTFNLTNDIATIQALAAWAAGWNSATISGQRLPTLEEMQALFYVTTSQLAYQFQEGIAEYDATTNYFIGSIVKNPSTFQLYGSKTDNNTGNALTDTVNWKLLTDLSSITAHGQCVLVKSGSGLALNPKNGNRLTINGINQTVPNAGVTNIASTSGLVSNTNYFIYAYMVSSTMTLEASVTAYALDATTGVTIKSGDATRTLVGMVRVNNSGAFADTASQRFVISYFNRSNISLQGAGSSSGNTASSPTTLVEISSAGRAEGLTWAGESVSASVTGYVSGSAAGTCDAAVGINGTTQINSACSNTLASSSDFKNISNAATTAPAEGYFNLTLLGGHCTGGITATYTFQTFGLIRG